MTDIGIMTKVGRRGFDRRFLIRDKTLGLPFAISCRPPHLVATFDAPQTMLSWSLTKPGFQTARRVAWREVRNADLPPTEDPIDSIPRLLADADLADAVILLRYYESLGEVKQVISVVKKRGGRHERTIRDFRLEEGGIRVGPPLREFRGVLTGVPVIERDAPGARDR